MKIKWNVVENDCGGHPGYYSEMADEYGESRFSITWIDDDIPFGLFDADTGTSYSFQTLEEAQEEARHILEDEAENGSIPYFV